MDAINNSLNNKIDNIRNQLGIKDMIIVKKIIMGKNTPLQGAIIYNNGLVNKEIIDRDILKPLMLSINENLIPKVGLCEYLSQRYITMSSTLVTKNINQVIDEVKRGKTALLVDKLNEYILIDTQAGQYRSISDPQNEIAARGSREAFVESLETNIVMIKRLINDRNLAMEKFVLGRRGQNDAVILYIEDIVDKDILNEVRKRITSIDVDRVASTGMIEQFIEDHPYSPFPQTYSTERVDKVCANIMEGRIAVILQGTPYVLTVPSLFNEFFHTTEDINERTIGTSMIRLLRFLSAIVIITVSPIYLTYIKFNSELIPIPLIRPIISSRIGIALNPFVEIMLMEIIIEFLREGGLRLPSKIAQTLSVVGGIIIGDTAVKSKFVSPTTLFIIGISVVASFVIPNNQMSIAIRYLRFPMLILAQLLGLLGIAAGWFLIIYHLSTMRNFGVPYISFGTEMRVDRFLRMPLWKMNNRSNAIPNNDKVRQTDFRKKWFKNK